MLKNQKKPIEEFTSNLVDTIVSESEAPLSTDDVAVKIIEAKNLLDEHLNSRALDQHIENTRPLSL